jgi:large subunit ribosomal protein L10
MKKSDKERVVSELAERLKSSPTLIIADYRGLTMPQIDALRSRLLEHGARFAVVKNTLTRRAAEQAGVEPLLTLLEGPTAIAFLESEGDPVAVAKALATVARETQVLVLRGGIMEGRAISEADVQTLAKLPPTDVLRGQLVGAIAAPMATVVGLFNAPLRDLVGVLQARIDQLETQGESTQVPEPEPTQTEEEGES